MVVVILVTKGIRYARISTHLRWELYPLAGEKDRPGGGSYLEGLEWWENPPEKKSFLGEMKFMAKEILLFKEYFHLNRDYWYFVYPFHIGIFLFVGFLALVFIGAITLLGDISVSAGSVSVWGRLVYYATLVTGVGGLVLGTVGSIGLLIKRRVSKDLRPYTRR